MVYFLANKLHQSPDDISRWGISVLCVMFADIVNAQYRENLKQYNDLEAKERAGIGKPTGIKIFH